MYAAPSVVVVVKATPLASTPAVVLAPPAVWVPGETAPGLSTNVVRASTVVPLRRVNEPGPKALAGTPPPTAAAPLAAPVAEAWTAALAAAWRAADVSAVVAPDVDVLGAGVV